MSARPSAWYNSAPMVQIFMKFDVAKAFLENSQENSSFIESDKTLHEDQYSFMIISLSSS